MKKIMMIAFTAVTILCSKQNVNAQIALNYVYSTNLPDRSVKLALSGLKYVNVHQTGPSISDFTLYNPDHSIFKTVAVPTWGGKNTANVQFISETLFDIDTLLEYYVVYTDGITNSMRICNENGVVLLERDSANIAGTGLGVSDAGYIPGGIFPNGNATTLMVRKGYGASATVEIYNLPGQLACLECVGGLVSGLAQPPGLPSEDTKSLAYPNPTNDYIKIKYLLPAHFNRAFVNLYDIMGKLITQKEIDGQYDDIYLSTEEIMQGAYSYEIVVDSKRMSSGKIIKL